MASKQYLDLTGLEAFWAGAKKYVDDNFAGKGFEKKVTDLETKTTSGTVHAAATASVANSVESAARTAIINEARSGLASSSTVSSVSGRVTTLEGKFSGTKANGSLDSDKLGGQGPSHYATKSSVDSLQTTVNGLSSATHFIGKFDNLPDGKGTGKTPTSGKKGDIVIVGNKEYIYNGSDGTYSSSSWVELGDTSALAGRVGTLEGKFDGPKANNAKYADNSNALDSHDSSYFATATSVSTLNGYFEGSKAKSAKNADTVNGLTVKTSVPENAVFTDTHYTTHLYAGSGTAANSNTSNGNTKLTVTDNSSVRNSVVIKGTGATTVTSDDKGNITINSVNTPNTDTPTSITGSTNTYITTSVGGSNFSRSISVTADVCTDIASAASTNLQLAEANAVKKYADECTSAIPTDTINGLFK